MALSQWQHTLWGCIEILVMIMKFQFRFLSSWRFATRHIPFPMFFLVRYPLPAAVPVAPPRVTNVLVFYLWLPGKCYQNSKHVCLWIPNIQVCDVCLLCFNPKLSHQALLVQGVNAELQGELEGNAPNAPLSSSKKRPTAPRTPDVDCSCMIYAEEHLVYACKFCSPSTAATVPRRPVGSPVEIRSDPSGPRNNGGKWNQIYLLGFLCKI